MENLIILGVIAVLMFFIGLYIGKKLTALKTETQHKITAEKLSSSLQEIENLKKEREDLSLDKTILNNKLIQQNEAFKYLQQKSTEQKEELKNLHEKFHKEFENLAHKILENNAEKFTELNKNNMENILSPLQERIKSFEEKVEKSKESSLQRHAELGKQLEQLNKQNLKISEEATNLTRALKGDSKMQGDWGEMILERVLELSGLKKEREYFVQKSFTTPENKRLQPDVVIVLPGEKRMIIDAKVSLTAYEKFINAEAHENAENYLQQHLTSLKKHINDLSRKKYDQLYQMKSPDFVLLFIPVEAAFALASQKYPRLYSEAFDKNIIIVTPTTLLAVLKTIDSMWQNEKQQLNAIEIATRAGKLHDSFVNLIVEFTKVGKQLNTVQGTYDSAMKKLTGRRNLVKEVEKLKELGAKTTKKLPSDLVD